jgi:hypothetical protein
VVTLPRDYEAKGEKQTEFMKVGTMFMNQSGSYKLYLYVDLRRGDELVAFEVGDRKGG